MLTSGFFNSVNGDRKYSAEQMSELFNGIINDGVFINIGTAFEVKADVGNQVTVGIGRAWFDSAWVNNDTIMIVELGESDILTDRIDAVVIEVDHSAPVRNGTIKVVEGTAQTNPVRPTMEHSIYVNQYPLAYILRPKNSTAITQANITYMVGTSETPFVTGILETINIDALVAQWGAEWGDWFDGIKDKTAGDIIEYQDAWDEWFQGIRDELTEDAAGNLQLQVDDVKKREIAIYGTISAKGWYRIAYIENDIYNINNNSCIIDMRTGWNAVPSEYKRVSFINVSNKNMFVTLMSYGNSNLLNKIRLSDDGSRHYLEVYYNGTEDIKSVSFVISDHLRFLNIESVNISEMRNAWNAVKSVISNSDVMSGSESTNISAYDIKPNVSGDITQYLPLSGGELTGGLTLYASDFSMISGRGSDDGSFTEIGELLLDYLIATENAFTIEGRFKDANNQNPIWKEFLRFNTNGIISKQPFTFWNTIKTTNPIIIDKSYISIGDQDIQPNGTAIGTRMRLRRSAPKVCDIEMTIDGSDWIPYMAFVSNGISVYKNLEGTFNSMHRNAGGTYYYNTNNNHWYTLYNANTNDFYFNYDNTKTIMIMNPNRLLLTPGVDLYFQSASTFWRFSAKNDNQFVLWRKRVASNDYDSAFYITSRGDTAGSFDMYIYGAYHNDSGLWESSSILVKENIKDLSAAYAENILYLRPVSFDYIKNYGESDQIGLIAEEVEEYFPEMVSTPEEINIEEHRVKSIDYTKLVVPLIKMVQIQQSEIDEQKRTIQDLEERVSRLESLLEKCIGPSKFKNEE